MPLSIAILCTSAILLHGASCHLFPQAITNSLTSIKHKRQAIPDSVVQCVCNELDAAFSGNNSRFVIDCKSAAIDEVEVSTDSSVLQSIITKIYRTFCNPECGKVVLDAYNECGFFDAALPGTEELSIGLCATNNDGDICYQLYGLGLDLVSSESNCYNTYVSSRTCPCHSTLLSGVAQQGCCINVYHDFISGLNSYNPNALYRGCNVNRPGDCNNSPLAPLQEIPTLPPTEDSNTASRTSSTTPMGRSTDTRSSSSSQVFCASATITILSACIYFALLR